MNMKATKKAQSAMEYLMTYGWAILIIAVVLGALFSLGVFSSSSFLGTACIPQSGYLCSNPIATTTGLTVTVGQATGASWSSVDFCFVPTGMTVPSACPTSYTSGGAIPATSTGLSLNSGQTTQVIFDAEPPSIPNTLGTGFSGQIWATYTSGSTTGLMTEIGSVTAKVS